MDAIALTEQNVGISIFPRTTANPGAHVVSRIISEPSRLVDYVLVWERNQPMSNVAR